MENFWFGAEATPVSGVRADMRLSVLGDTPASRIDQLYWEAAGQERLALDAEGQTVDLGPLQRTRVHDAGFEIDRSLAKVQGYYRQGHFHWGYEGDVFGIYREANYGPNPDIYQAAVPVGVEVTGKGALSPLKLAMGPQIYWGANPTVIAKLRDDVGPVTLTLTHQEDLARSGNATTSSAISEPRLRRSALVLETGKNGEALTLGGIWAGSNKVGQGFQTVSAATGAESFGGSGFDVLDDELRMADTLGFRAKFARSFGPVSAYIQGASRASSPTPAPTRCRPARAGASSSRAAETTGRCSAGWRSTSAPSRSRPPRSGRSPWPGPCRWPTPPSPWCARRACDPPGGHNLPVALHIGPPEAHTDIGWEVAPTGLRDLLMRVHRDYAPPSIVITENGASYADGPSPDGQVHDARRQAYFEGHLGGCHEAIAAGVPLHGYFAWSLMDNFEWAYGYAQRFGLVHVDYETQQRTPKDSLLYLAGVMAYNALPT